MHTTRICNHLRVALKHSALALALGAAVIFGNGPTAQAAVTYDFSTGLQGWTQIDPTAGDLWAADFGWPAETGSLGHLGAGWNDSETQMGRSPAFTLVGSEDLTFQLFGSKSSLAAVDVTPSTVPATAIDLGGFCGLALRDVAADTYVLSKGLDAYTYEAFATLSFSAAELAPYANDGKMYTLDWIDYDKDISSGNGDGWGWLVNVSIPGVLFYPANDNFANAIDLLGTTGTQTGTDNIHATLEVGEPATVTYPDHSTSSFNNSVWFKWTCTADGKFTVSTKGSTNTLPTPGEWDAVLGIYSGSSVNALTPLGASPLDTGLEEAMTVAVTAGTTYHIQLAGYDSAVAANILLNWSFVPAIRAEIETFGPGATIGALVANAATIAWTVPYGTNLATLTPTFTLSPGATCTVGGLPLYSGDLADLSSPVNYTITSSGISPTVNVYTVTVSWGPANTACDITSFGTDVAGSMAVITPSGTVDWYLPYGTDMTTLAPNLTLSSGATSVPVIGTTRDFTLPQTYTITAQDGSTTKDYTVTPTVSQESALVWNTTNGDWDSLTANWTGQSTNTDRPFSNGDAVIFSKTAGGTINIAAGMLPTSTTVSATSGNYIFSGQPVGSGSLIKSGGGQLSLEVTPANFSNIAVNGGNLYLHAAGHYLGTGTPINMGTGGVTVESGGTLMGERAYMAGSLTMNGGRWWENNGFGGSWTGTVYLAADSYFGQNGWCCDQSINGEISGPGGVIKNGGMTLTLTASNSYTGATTVTGGTIKCNHVNALGSGALSISSTIGTKVNLNYSGEHNVAALTLGGMPQASGTYGSTASPATNKNDTYFAGTGMVTVPASSFNNMLTFSFGALGSATINDTTITMEVPNGTDRTNLAPTYTVSAGATCLPLPGTPLNFTGTQSYTVTAEDGITAKTYLVTVTETVLPDVFTWASAASGNWSVPANWTNELATVSAPLGGGRASYTLNFTAPGTYTASNNMNAGFELNQLNFGSTVTLAGNSLAFVANGPTQPMINQNSGSTATLSNDLDLGSNAIFGGSGNGQVNLSGSLTGTGMLIKNSSGTMTLSGDFNTYSGGTTINAGSLNLGKTANNMLGTGPVTVNSPATLNLNGNGNLTNEFTFNGARVNNGNSFSANLNGPITLEATTTIDLGTTGNMTIGGSVSGPGGLTKLGAAGPLVLSGTNTYTGPTTVTSGTLKCNNVNALGSGDLSVSASATVNLNYTGDHVVTSLTLAGAVMPPGTYDSSDPSGRITGSGTVTVGGLSGYGTWASTNAPGQTPGQDYDNDGVANGIEYFMGQTGSAFTTMPGLDATNTITWPKDPNYSGTWQIQTSPDLEAWTDVAGTDNTTSVSYTLPTGMGKLFVRLLVTPSP